MYIVVFRKIINGKTEYGVLGAYPTKELAEEYISQNQDANIKFTIAVMERN